MDVPILKKWTGHEAEVLESKYVNNNANQTLLQIVKPKTTVTRNFARTCGSSGANLGINKTLVK